MGPLVAASTANQNGAICSKDCTSSNSNINSSNNSSAPKCPRQGQHLGSFKMFLAPQVAASEPLHLSPHPPQYHHRPTQVNRLRGPHLSRGKRGKKGAPLPGGSESLRSQGSMFALIADVHVPSPVFYRNTSAPTQGSGLTLAYPAVSHSKPKATCTSTANPMPTALKWAQCRVAMSMA